MAGMTQKEVKYPYFIVENISDRAKFKVNNIKSDLLTMDR